MFFTLVFLRDVITRARKKKKEQELCYIFLRGWTDSTGWVHLLKSRHVSYKDKNISRDCITTEPSQYCDPGILANWVGNCPCYHARWASPANQTSNRTAGNTLLRRTALNLHSCRWWLRAGSLHVVSG